MTSHTSTRVLARISTRLALLAFACLLPAPTVLAHGTAFARFAGGGPRKSDCMLVTDAAGVPDAHRARVTRCTDGDPECDVDGAADGTCTFRVRLCLHAAEARCHEDTVTSASLSSAAPEFAALATALAAVPTPAVLETCSTAVRVPVATRGRSEGRLALRAQAIMASGHADNDQLVFVCRPLRSRTTFATIEQKIFATSCTTASCHGAGAAGGLTLTQISAYASLVGVPATNEAAKVRGLLRVAPGDPDGSFLLQKLTGTLAPDEGEPMPWVGEALPDEKIDLVWRWIAAGAPADAPF